MHSYGLEYVPDEVPKLLGGVRRPVGGSEAGGQAAPDGEGGVGVPDGPVLVLHHHLVHLGLGEGLGLAGVVAEHKVLLLEQFQCLKVNWNKDN